MDIHILQLLAGAKQARGLTVVIDVFRAFSVEAYLYSRGVERIIPLADADEAYRLKALHPEWLLIGERHGKILPGFDGGNSPYQLQSLPVAKKTVVHTTSAGTQGIAAAVSAGAAEILGGSLLTARAIAEYIRHSGAENVSLVCMGWNATHPTEEDTLCAEYIRAMLTDTPFDLAAGIAHVRRTEGAKFFDPARQDVFPEGDFHMCVDADRFPFVLRYGEGADGLPFMQKIPRRPAEQFQTPSV